MSLKVKLSVMSFLQFAVWGAYLTSMGNYLASIGMASKIGLFYAVQGIVSIIMPDIMGIIADRWIPAQRLLSYCHILAALFIILAGYYGYSAGTEATFSVLFALYSCSVAFYMPTIALSNSVAIHRLPTIISILLKPFRPYVRWEQLVSSVRCFLLILVVFKTVSLLLTLEIIPVLSVFKIRIISFLFLEF